MQRALVIGATGFVGRHVTRALVESGVDVRAMRRWNSELESLREIGVEDVVCDLGDDEAVHQALRGFNYVHYVAAPDVGLPPSEYFSESVRMIRTVLRHARDAEVDQLIVTSCASTLGHPEGRRADEEDYYLPGSAGDERVEALYAAELECFREAADGLPISILNPTICVGSGARLPGRSALGHLDADSPINVVDVHDVASAHVEVTGRHDRARRYLIGGSDTTVEAFYRQLESKGTASLRTLSDGIEFVSEPSLVRNFDLFRRGQWVETTRARRELDHQPGPIGQSV